MKHIFGEIPNISPSLLIMTIDDNLQDVTKLILKGDILNQQIYYYLIVTGDCFDLDRGRRNDGRDLSAKS